MASYIIPQIIPKMRNDYWICVVISLAQYMFKKIQSQRVNWISKLIVSMLTKKEGSIDLPDVLEMIGWRLQSELPMLLSLPCMLTK